MATHADKLEIIESETINNRHHIFQTDETITVLCTEEPQILSHDNKFVHNTPPLPSDNQRSDDNQHHSRANQKTENIKTNESLATMNEKSQESGSEPFPKSILTNCDSEEAKVSTAKKSVSFETDDSINKFISGEEIVDKRNPFRSPPEEDSTEYRITKVSKSGGIPRRIIPVNSVKAPKATEESDFISKEEILKQSKYVPVYIRNPDRVLTYDKSVLERLSTKSNTSTTTREIKRVPVPTPRKGLLPVRKVKEKPKEKEKKKTKQHRAGDPRYPDLADIKVKVGTDIDESLYDPNEVVLNAKKFDSLFQKAHFSSTEDIDEIVEMTMDKSSNDAIAKSQENDKDESKDDDKKSYTNTVNSKEFREYLKKKGLLLFPTKANGTKEPPKDVPVIMRNNTLKATTRSLDQVDDASFGMNSSDKKKTVFRRLSSIFSKTKTSPKEHERKTSFTARRDENGSSAIKRVFLERSSFQSDGNRSIPANNEFISTNNYHKQNGSRYSRTDQDDEDKKSSISSVLTAAADDEVFEDTPVVNRRNKPETSSLYRNIDVNRSKLYRLNDDVIKPRAYHPNRAQPAIKSPVSQSTPIRRSSERQFSPVLKATSVQYKPSSRDSSIPMKIHNSNGYHVEQPRMQEKQADKSASLSRNKQINAPKTPDTQNTSAKPSEIDPFTFAKIHEIKRKTDEVLLNKSMTLDNGRQSEVKLNNQNFVRNSQQRSTITEGYQKPQAQPQENNYRRSNNLLPNSSLPRQPPRSQSVLDNMTCYKDSLYGEVSYRQPNGNNVNVIMRRPDSSTLDRKQIMQKIYEYYRKSVNNTPVSFQEKQNLYVRSQSSNTPTSFASDKMTRSPLSKIPPKLQNDYLVWQNYSNGREINLNIPKHFDQQTTRKPTISESDSEFFSESLSSRDYARYAAEKSGHAKVLSYKSPHQDQNQIYDVVYCSPRNQKPKLELYAQVKHNRKDENPYERQAQRGAPGRDHMSPTPTRQISSTSTTPVPLYSPSKPLNQMDIIYNNQIYRPIAALKTKPATLQRQSQPLHPDQKRNFYGNQRLAVMKEKELLTPESDGSETGEVQRIMQNRYYEEDYQNDKTNRDSRNQQNDQVIDERSRRGSGRRDERDRDIRRHTMGSDMLHYGNQGGSLQRSMDLEGIPIRAYTPQHQGPLFDDDPGIMSEVETASTGFRRGGKQRSSLPVVRTPSKTLERPLGLVFLQYRSETKRALLPNEITSIDTVRALFVRSFPRQLSMMYLEGPNVKIYIHDSSKDMFYELEDVRSHLREIRDRSVLRLFESNEVAAAPQILSGSPGIPQQLPQQMGHWDQDPSYFSEPEFDTEYQHQHIHKSKGSTQTQTLPRGHVYNDRSKNSMSVPAKPIRSYGSRGSLGQISYPSDQLYSIPDGYMSSPERGSRAYEEPYYTQYGGMRGNSATPIIDEEQSNPALTEDQYSMYSVKVPNRISRNPNNQMYDTARPEDMHRFRVEHMERQLANLTGIVHKVLVQNPTVNPAVNQQQMLGTGGHYRNANGALDDLYIREKPPKLGKSYKSVSFEKSVSFSDDIQGVPKSHSPQHMAADSKPPKPAIKSSTLPRTSSQERDRLKPVPPLKQQQVVVNQQYRGADLTLAPEAYNHLRSLQKKTRDLRTEVKTLRRLAQTQAVAVREDIKDTFMRIRATLLASSGNQWGQGDQERTRISREEEIYKQEVIRLEKDLADLEGSVEVLRGEVINRRTRVNMAAVEDMALVLSRASKTVAELKMRFPSLQLNLRTILSNEMERVCREETFLKDEPDRLEVALRRCKKLTGTLVTLKRLASVQEQRTNVEPPATEEIPRSASDYSANSNKPTPAPRHGGSDINEGLVPENALDALLDELQTFAKPLGIDGRPDESAASDDSSQTLQSTVTTKLSQSQLYPEPVSSSMHGLRRLHSYPSGSDTDQDQISPPRPIGKPPVPERNSELLSRYGHKKLPPPPPPRSSSSRSPMESPTSPNLPPRGADQQMSNVNNNNAKNNNNNNYNNQYLQNDPDSGSESNNSQDNNSQRQLQLEMRHQELLKKQKQLQEQYQRLQQMSSIPLAPGADTQQTGSDSNLSADKANDNVAMPQPFITTNKVYETDIL